MSLIVLLDSEPLGLATNPKQSAEFWAQVRQAGLPTADRFALDVDVILCAQAATLDPEDYGMAGASIVIATGNVAHLSRLANAKHWQDIS
jgi:hypothetical protein